MQLGSESTRSRWLTGLLYALTCLIGLGAVSGCGRDEAPVDPQVYLDAHDLNKNLELVRSKDARMRILGCIRLGRMGAESQSALAELEKMAAKDKEPKVRKAAADAVAKIKSPAS